MALHPEDLRLTFLKKSSVSGADGGVKVIRDLCELDMKLISRC